MGITPYIESIILEESVKCVIKELTLSKSIDTNSKALKGLLNISISPKKDEADIRTFIEDLKKKKSTN